MSPVNLLSPPSGSTAVAPVLQFKRQCPQTTTCREIVPPVKPLSHTLRPLVATSICTPIIASHKTVTGLSYSSPVRLISPRVDRFRFYAVDWSLMLLFIIGMSDKNTHTHIVWSLMQKNNIHACTFPPLFTGAGREIRLGGSTPHGPTGLPSNRLHSKRVTRNKVDVIKRRFRWAPVSCDTFDRGNS